MDPVGAQAARAVLDEDPHAVLPGTLDHARDFDRRQRLRGDGVGGAVGGRRVSLAGGVGVKADAGDGVGAAVVHSPPGVGERADLRAVDRHTGAEMAGMVGADASHDTRARRRVADEQAIRRRVHDGEVGAGLAGQRGADLGDRAQDPPGRPVDRFAVGEAPRAADRGEVSVELAAIEARGVDVSQERIDVAPRAQPGERRRLAGAQPDRRLRRKPEDAAGQGHVCLGHERVRGELLGERGLAPVVVVDPVGRPRQVVITGHRVVEELGKPEAELAPHARIGRGGHREDEGQLALDRPGAVDHPLDGTAAEDHLARGGALGGEAVRGGEDDQTRGSDVGFAAGRDGGEEGLGIGARVHVERGPAVARVAARAGLAGRCLDEDELGVGAAQGVDVDRDGARARPGRPRRRRRARLQDRPFAQGERRSRDVEQSRRGVGVAKERREIGERARRCRKVIAEDRQDGLAGMLGVLEPAQHQGHRGVARELAIGGQERPRRGFVHRLARQIHGADQRGIDLPGGQRAGGEVERGQSGDLLGRHGEAGATQIERRGQAIGRQVGHRAQHRGGHERRRDRVAREGQLGVGHLAGAAPADAEARGLEVAAHADDHRGPRVGQRPRAGEGLVGGLHHHQLLAERSPQILGRELDAGDRQDDLGGGAGAALARQQRGDERLGPRPIAGDHPDGDDGDRAARARRAHGRRVEIGGLPDEVGVVAAKAERAHRGAARAGPRLGGVEQAKGRLRQGLERLLGVERGRLDGVLDRAEDLDEPGHSGDGDEVPEVGLERAERDVAAIGEDPSGAADLGAVTDHGAGGVALQEAHVAGPQAGQLIGAPDRGLLSFFRRHQQPRAAPVVGQSHAANHAEDPIAGGARVLQTLEDDEAGPFRRQEPVGVAMKWAAASARRDRAQRREAGVQEEVIGAVDRARQHEIGAAVMQPVAGQLDGIERGRTGGVEREGARAQAERARQDVRRQP